MTDQDPSTVSPALLAATNILITRAFEEGRRVGYREGLDAVAAGLENLRKTSTSPMSSDDSLRATFAGAANPFELPIEELDFSVRAYNCLKLAGLNTIGDLVSHDEPFYLDIRNFGARSIEELKTKLAILGLKIMPPPPGFEPAG